MAEMKEAEMVETGERDAHTEHCCVVHGCKYGDDDCPVTTRRKPQSFPCEDCPVEPSVIDPIPARLAAAEARRMPDEIEKAIRVVLETQRAFSGLDRHPSNREALKASIACSDALDALNAAILARLTAAEAERDEAIAEAARLKLREQQMGYRVEAAEAQLEDAVARVEKLEKALERIAGYPQLYNDGSVIHSTGWVFSTLKAIARTALAHPAPAEET